MTQSLEQEIYCICVELGQRAMQKGVTMATAESCTAGGISYCITEVPGSSRWFDRGFVTYTNQAKTEMLGVTQATLSAYGAVSEETVREMAMGALEKSGAHIAVAVSGIAGPGGAVPGKPLGTVCFGFARRGAHGPVVFTDTQYFSGDRKAVRLATIRQAIQGLITQVDHS
ncbi:MAG: CinA family protein [Sutterellaceae bacterium]|nr:CinA family protein [Sutterellaceae bacterium]